MNYYKQADEILKISGIDKICRDCCTGKRWPHRSKEFKDITCCEGKKGMLFEDTCEHLSKNGCTIESLGCKLWFCNEPEMLKLIKKAGKLKEWEQIKKSTPNRRLRCES